MGVSEETHIFFSPVGCCPTTGHFLFLAGLILSSADIKSEAQVLEPGRLGRKR